MIDAGIAPVVEGGSLLVARVQESGELFFSLGIDTTGEYDFQLIAENPTIPKNVDLSTVPPGNYPEGIYYDEEANGGLGGWTDTNTGEAELYIYGSDIYGNSLSINPSGQGIGAADNQFEINEQISFVFTSDVTSASITTIRSAGNESWDLEVSWTLYNDGNLVDSGTVVFTGPGGTFDFGTIDEQLFDTLVLEGLSSAESTITNDKSKFTLAELEYNETLLPSETDFQFDVDVTDGDGDTDSDSLIVTIGTGSVQQGFELSGDKNAESYDDVIYGSADSNDVLNGGIGNDVLNGGIGNDVLYGDTGADQFIFDNIGQGVDVIKDFSADEGDVLDLSGVIQNYDPEQDAIDDFIFSREESGGTILSVDVSGSGDVQNAVDFVALDGVTNVDLNELFTMANINVS
jgi:hypothetical protein